MASGEDLDGHSAMRTILVMWNSAVPDEALPEGAVSAGASAVDARLAVVPRQAHSGPQGA